MRRSHFVSAVAINSEIRSKINLFFFNLSVALNKERSIDDVCRRVTIVKRAHKLMNVEEFEERKKLNGRGHANSNSLRPRCSGGRHTSSVGFGWLRWRVACVRVLVAQCSSNSPGSAKADEIGVRPTLALVANAL